MSARPAVIAALLRATPTAAERTDDVLLADFFADRDEAAFAEIVRRHQRTVWGVCRRTLSNAADAEDAFQATFLVLARRGRTLADRGSVGGWLYRVARRVSLKARAMATKRRRVEAHATGTDAAAAEVRASDADLMAVLGEELDRLPEKDRLAVIVCDLDGLSRADAAVRLGWKEGTLSARLHRARRKLAAALARRGVELPAAGLIGVLSVGAAPAAAATAAAKLAVSGATMGAVPAAVAALVHSTLREMTMRLTTKILAALAVATVAIGGGWGVLSGESPVATAAPVPAKSPEKAPELPPTAYRLLQNRKVLKELKCTPEQRVNIEDSIDEQREKGAGKAPAQFEIQVVPGVNPAQIEQQIAAVIQAQWDAEVKIARTAGEKYLTARQLARLGQIEVQWRGVKAFTDDKLVAALKLTDKQKELIRAEVNELKTTAELPFGLGGLPGAVVESVGGLQDGRKIKAAVEKVEASLTKEQLAAWEKVTGDKVKFDLHAESVESFGGGTAVPALPVIPAQPAPVLPVIPAQPPAPKK